jgi:SAM-dependent methyltransferase
MVTVRNRSSEVEFSLWTLKLRSRKEFVAFASSSAEILNFRRGVEAGLEESVSLGGRGLYQGYCSVCKAHSTFEFERPGTPGMHVNWRESLVCRGCGLPNRIRLTIQFLQCLVGDVSGLDVYVSEQVTPTAQALRRLSKGVVCSEYLGSNVPPGSVNAAGIRHEDLTRLSFTSSLFDAAVSCDVLEHIPDYRQALAEFHRVLKDGGVIVVSVPFGCGTQDNVVRAIVREDGSIHHLLPAEFHGDPVNPDLGSLCYYHFGWELLEDFKAAGFRDAWVELFWSSDYGYIGSEQPLLVAVA